MMFIKIHQKLPKLLLLEKPRHVTLIKIFEIRLFSALLKTYVYLRVSFSSVDIIVLKEEELFNQKILKIGTKINFFGGRFGYLEEEQR